MEYIVKKVFQNQARTGVDAKLLQYDHNAKTVSDKIINLQEIIGKTLFKKEVDCNCIMINLEKDVERYHNTLEEFKKISINNFVHLKGTYWKNKEQLEQDMSFIKEFLKQFIPEIDTSYNIQTNEFSEINDNNIHIQDGPLGCYCSHLRGMIYGLCNFKDYTIMVEDDISITNTENIEKYLSMIPDDWDIVCIGAIGKNIVYDQPYYKFLDEFHSTHFYIINHKCMPQLLKHMYPVTDQVDVLIAEMVHELNIYNIPDTVYQKCISSNTQNNLHTIFNAKYYDVLREQIEKIKKSCLFFANKILPDNETRNETIVNHLLYDVLYSYITEYDTSKIDEKNSDQTDYVSEYSQYQEYDDLFTAMVYFISCSKKTDDVLIKTAGLMNDIVGVLKNFKLHNTFDSQYDEQIKAYNYGATAQTYLLEESGIIIKAYNNKLRWTVPGHNNSDEIFRREVSLLKLDVGPKLISYNEQQKIIKMEYCGESLYDNFKLPHDWKIQITEIFEEFDEVGIYYPEFKIKNILVKDGRITFIDYGLARMSKGIINNKNCEKFIQLLSLLEQKFKGVEDKEQRYQLYSTFVHNMKVDNTFY